MEMEGEARRGEGHNSLCECFSVGISFDVFEVHPRIAFGTLDLVPIPVLEVGLDGCFNAG